MARVMLSGATIGSNFGDFLFAQLFYGRICELNRDGETYFYESRYAMSDFFKKHLGYNFDYSRKKIVEADALVYISGGYFGEREKSLKESIIRFLRYMIVGCYFVVLKKPIAIIGIGVGPLSSIFLRYITKKIFNHASVITVRDIQSKEYLKCYNVSKEIMVATDSAQVLSPIDFAVPIEHLAEGEVNSQKLIFLHINPGNNGNNAIIKKIIEPLNEFLLHHHEYGVIIGCDQYSQSAEVLYEVKKSVVCSNVLLFHYNEPLKLCSLLNAVDLIITTKLHVGIIGATFSKSVVSISGHSSKILRYYEQIGERRRAVELNNCTYGQVLDLLNKYHDIPITLDKKILELARTNFDELDRFIQDIVIKKQHP